MLAWNFLAFTSPFTYNPPASITTWLSNFALPATCSLYSGEATPIPTFPSGVIFILRSVPAVKKAMGWSLSRVPIFTALLVKNIPALFPVPDASSKIPASCVPSAFICRRACGSVLLPMAMLPLAALINIRVFVPPVTNDREWLFEAVPR